MTRLVVHAVAGWRDNQTECWHSVGASDWFGMMFDVEYQGKSKGNFAEFCKNSCEDEVASAAIIIIMCIPNSLYFGPATR